MPGKNERPSGAAPIADFLLGVALTGFGVLVLIDSRNIPDPVFEQFGAAKVPQAAAAMLVLFSLAVIVMSANRIFFKKSAAPAEEDADGRTAWVPLVSVSALLLAHTLAISVLGLGFVTASFLALVAMFLVLEGLAPRTVAVAVVTAALASIGLYYAFTAIFRVDLP